ncbi:hypothetical protein LRS05_06625 [Flavobacterium sp. J372]|uniref:toxin-antitoxin system YwqK family antitoxin n=1 Tax=Flavobacterium sp. J372 TaxID=2898436 RepID=UPI0021511AC7|nr:hypothetical protein [Flavobacterium sp. J372]MCR5861832.1 hypothetical protein [Flavobacterium sp. J372]
MKSIIVTLLLFFISLVGRAQDINKMDAEGKRHGLWKGIYEDTKLPRYEGTFEHGKETGVFRFFENSKKSPLAATREFSAKDNSCYTIFYGEKEKKTGEGREVNKIRQGEWKFYHPDGKTIMSVENYKDGKIIGTRKVYFPDGKIAEETVYTDGIKNGPYKKYTEKGLVLEEAVYVKDQFHGPATYRNDAGQVVSTGQYKNGKKAGLWKFYKDRKLEKEVDMSASRKRP